MSNNLMEYIQKNSKKKDENLKYDFMPDLQEIIERPAHKAGSIIIWGIFLLLVFVIVWSSVSKVEVVISAHGTIVPVKEETIISAKTTYNIDSIKVNVGQIVKAGDVLVELSCKGEMEKKQELQEQIADTENIIALYNRVLKKEDISNVDASTYDPRIQSEIKEILKDFKSNKDMCDTYLENKLKDEAENVNKLYIGQITEDLQDEQTTLEKANKDLSDVMLSIASATVVAPYDAIICNLYVATENIVVYEDQPIVSFIRQGAELEMECYVSNNEIADIEIGQNVNLKLDAYPYGDYGMIDGTVSFVGEKSQNIEGLGNVVLIKVAITDEDFDEKVFSGLTGTADMIIGERRIIEYFIAPITDALKESIRER
ncbi:MAG: HlyD family efflux transporter periplasmic adaptor subunit [Lachnospira sp.]|nr:HlyD family efflux transporter periplasmic adaptor subunit [Lachnospira sp.]